MPCALIALALCEPALATPGRAIAISVHRPGFADLLVVNVYAHAGCPRERDALIRDVISNAKRINNDHLLLGDWNCESDEGGVGLALGNGLVSCCDETFGFNLPPTRPAGHRRIDYGLSSHNLFANELEQQRGPQDHDLVVYGFEIGDPVIKFVRPVMRRLDRITNVADAEFDTIFETDIFRQMLTQGDVDRAWAYLSGICEILLTGDTSHWWRNATRVHLEVLPY